MKKLVFFFLIGSMIMVSSWLSSGGTFVSAESEEKPLNLPGKIIFDSDREYMEYEGQQYLSTFLLAEGQMKPVVPGGFARFTRGGKKIIYSTGTKDAIFDLETKKTEFPEWTRKHKPAFGFDISPDGQWVAFTSHKVLHTKYKIHPLAEPELNLMVSRIDGSDLRQLTDAPAGVGGSRWSPDGKLILFRCGLDLEKSGQESGQDKYKISGGLYLADPFTGDIRKLPIDTKLAPSGGSWTPDSRHIVFTGDNPKGTEQLFVFDLKTNEMKQITKNQNSNWRYMAPVVSPNGDQILFLSTRQIPTGIERGTNLFVMNIDGTNERQVTPSQKIKKYGRWRWATDSDPDWAP